MPNILIVEDDTITRFMMCEVIDELGYPHELAVSGTHCLSMMHEHPSRADIVLMDIHMPGLSGVETCASLREFYQNQPTRPIIIALTADEFWQSPQNSAAAGFDDVICKPISIKAVRQTLQKATQLEFGRTG